MTDMKRIVAFNEDQIDHVIIVQRQVLNFCHKIMTSAIEHDRSKFSSLEYEAFVASRESLNQSKTGNDEDYQKHLKGEAIQHHIHNNPHHAEYWDKRGEKMPVHEVISMFFDWRSRSIAKGGGMEGFWEYNLAKLKNQPHAIPIVEALREEYEALEADPDLTKCPRCGGPADNGNDRCVPPNPYYCTKCTEQWNEGG